MRLRNQADIIQPVHSPEPIDPRALAYMLMPVERNHRTPNTMLIRVDFTYTARTRKKNKNEVDANAMTEHA